ncbi:bifunctional diguanylate cyclase/phosphodiesterase [Oceanobacillus sp. Castelsardo]|uniref:sensor domain-containing protein n=1 Tax=Oceanobacillus sp. Castelsardo TaxID=1851204 RepID=UPI000838FED7|nr:PAS domain S-box protein [Oceanobacillus sp. Castelsardo]
MSYVDRELLDVIDDKVFVIRVAQESLFIYDFLNRAAITGTDLTKNVLGKSIKEVYPQDFYEFLYKKYRKVVTTREKVTYEDSYLSPSGDRHYSKTTLSPLFDDNERITKIVAVVKDITKEKQHETEIKKVLAELNTSKKSYQSLYQHDPDAIFTFDLEGRITNGNLAVENVTGYTPIELIGATINSIVVKDDVHLIKKLLMQAVTGVTEYSRFRILSKKGQKIDVSFKVTPIIVDNEIIGIYGIFRDVTDALKSRRQLKESEERFRIIAENAHDLITLLDSHGNILYASPSYKHILGFDQNAYIGKSFLYHVHPDDEMLLKQEILHSLRNAEAFNIELRQFNHKGIPIWCEASGTPVFDDQNNLKYMVVLTRDIQLRKQYNDKLEQLALHDYLTGLPNRLLFNRKIKQALDDFQIKQDGLAVIMMDIDKFKNINDELGHDIGDEVIKEFAKRVSQAIRKKDMVARLGGDEFIALLPSIGSSENAVKIADNIKQIMQMPWNIKGYELKVTTSMGIAMAPSEDATKYLLLKTADKAMYEAKEDGRNTYKIWDDSII